ncbi:SPRY domain-containing SOCS box protein 4 [Homalodisca vitripennis]|nr:SPRY domain-containing SOCS box protein 4 [Homalodisca vitripennis]
MSADGEDSQYRSWGWDLVTTKLFVDGVVHNGEGDRCYPLQQTEERYTVPDKFHVVLDMTDGTLSFIVNSKWLGTALSGMAGHCLYPIVSSRQGNCRIWRWLRWSMMQKHKGNVYRKTTCLVHSDRLENLFGGFT